MIIRPWIGIFLAMVFLGFSSAQGEIYSWKDASGRTHFSDQKPEDVSAQSLELKINTINAPSVSESDFLDARERGKVVMYSAVWCGVYKKARRYFQQEGIAFNEYDIETSRNGRRDYEALNGRGVPIILVGSKRMDGFSTKRFMSLYEGNKSR